MDSTTTITSSMISPTAMASPPRLIRLKDMPARSMIRIVMAMRHGDDRGRHQGDAEAAQEDVDHDQRQQGADQDRNRAAIPARRR